MIMPITTCDRFAQVGCRDASMRGLYQPDPSIDSGAQGKELVEKIKEIRTAALNDLVDRQLILQEFEKNKFNIPDYVIDEKPRAIYRNLLSYLRELRESRSIWIPLPHEVDRWWRQR